MKITSSTLRLLSGVAALSAAGTTATLADKPAPKPPRIKVEESSAKTQKLEVQIAFTLLDANKDGKVSAEEFAKRHHHLVAIIRSKQAVERIPTHSVPIKPFLCETCGRG